MLIYIINIIVVLCALIFPGMTIFQIFFNKQQKEWTRPFRIVLYVIISVAIIYLFAFFLGEISIPLFIKRVLAVSIILGSILFQVIQRLQKWRPRYEMPPQKVHYLLYSITIVIIIAWMSGIRFQSYPGVMSLGMGDIPEYYVLAKNIYIGEGFTTDYFIGDFWVGPKLNIEDVVDSAPTSARRPLVPYIASYFFYISGDNFYIINIIASLLASIFPLAFYGFMYQYRLDKKFKISWVQNLFDQFVALLLCFIPSHFVLYALGTITIFESLPLFIIFILIKLKKQRSNFSIFIISLSAGITTVSRPEGMILILAISLVYFLPWIIVTISKKNISKKLSFIALFIGSITIMNVPLLSIHYHNTRLNSFWILTACYDSNSKHFNSIYFHWPEFNRAITIENFSKSPDIKNTINVNLISDALSNPIPFFKWVIQETIKKMIAFASLYGKITTILNTTTVTNIVAIIIFICLILGPARETLLFLFFFTMGFALLNPVIYARQAIAVSPILLTALFLTFDSIYSKFCIKNTTKVISIYNNEKCSLKYILYLIMFLYMIILTSLLTKIVIKDIVIHKENRKYESSLAMVRKNTEPNSIIISDYPQLINLMTGRISLGASYLLDILNPELDRYQPNYVLINDCRPNRSYTQFITNKVKNTSHYIIQNYTVVEHKPEEHVILLKHH